MNNGLDMETALHIIRIRKKFMGLRHSVRALSPFVPDPVQVTIKQSSYNNTGSVKGFMVTYPGASIENGIIYHIHGGGFIQGFDCIDTSISLYIFI